MNSLLQRFKNLKQSEQRLLLLTLLLGIGLLLWTQWLEPGYKQLQNLRQLVPALQQDLSRMRQNIARVAPQLLARGKKSGKDRTTVLQHVEKTADHNGIRSFIRRIKPDKNNTVKVWLEGVAFDKWLLWLTELQNKTIMVTAANVSRAKKQRVNIRMTLLRP